MLVIAWGSEWEGLVLYSDDRFDDARLGFGVGIEDVWQIFQRGAVCDPGPGVNLTLFD